MQIIASASAQSFQWYGSKNKYFSGYNLKNAGGKQKFGYAKNVQFGWEIFTLSPVDYIAVDLVGW